MNAARLLGVAACLAPLAMCAQGGGACATIAFPGAGQTLPFVEKAYMIGAVPRGILAVTVQGREVRTYRTGAWATQVDVTEGTNTVCVAIPGFSTNHVFCVAKRPPPPSGGVDAPKEKTWTKLEYCGDVPKPHPAGKKPHEITIVVDPGHGGADTGAISPHGLYEKNANLLQAEALRRELESRGYRVLMTREDDVALVLTERPRLAHTGNADAFISIHHNAPAANGDAAATRYTSVYSWNPLGERLAGALAGRMTDALAAEMPSKGTLHANFAVTRNPEIPSCLVEVDFITSPAGEEAVFNNARRAEVANAIADGVDDWVASR